MEKLSSCQNHEKNVMVRLPRDFTKIIKKGLLKEKINKRSIPSIDFVAPNDRSRADPVKNAKRLKMR